ncbi:MAG: FAD-binding oxidoreductase [Rhodobacteraceae bacterium]|nr:MAG: FAD-binding oxidoreductase [Paracoccaceae bacterium]
MPPLTADFTEALRARLPADVFRSPEPRYFEEPRGRWQGKADLVLAPGETAQVATILAAAHAARVPVVPYGGGTGLVGGQVAQGADGALVLSLERMNRIRAVYPDENVMIAEAGVILADIQAAAERVDRLFPLSLASEGSARIGGNLATNAGGTAVLRYGNARDLCLGLEAVLADGRVWNGLSRLRKDNMGYDLRNLLIGSEGTLGIITAASLKLFARPAGTGTALLVVESPGAALRLLSMARGRFAEGITAFELMSGTGFDFLAEKLPDIRRPFDPAPAWCVLIEVGLARGLDPAQALEDLFAEAAGAGLASDGLIAQSQAQADAFWAVREQIPEANRRIGAVSSHDISVPLSAIPDFIARGAEAIAAIGAFRINCFGHVGDGNLHFNVFPMPGRSRADHDAERGAIKAAVHDLVHDLGGSVSAEHGVGRLKVEDLERYGDPVKLAAMRAIKAALDPHGILNPGAVLRA